MSGEQLDFSPSNLLTIFLHLSFPHVPFSAVGFPAQNAN